jgi:hypothetical protein
VTPIRRIAVLAATAVVSVAFVGCGTTTTTVATSPAASGPGIRASVPPWAPEYRHLATRLRLLGLPAAGSDKFHIHALLNISVDVQPVAVPANIGIDAAHHLESTLHTHDQTGVIHMEAPHPFAYTLGDLFAAWGVRFTHDQLGALRAHGDQQLHVYVNGRSVGDPANYVMRNRDNIAIGFGTDASFSHTPGTAMLGLVESGGLTCSASSASGGPICAAPKKPAHAKAKTAS